MFTRLSSTADGTPASCIPQIYASGIVESAEGLRPWICMEVQPKPGYRASNCRACHSEARSVGKALRAQRS